MLSQSFTIDCTATSTIVSVVPVPHAREFAGGIDTAGFPRSFVTARLGLPRSRRRPPCSSQLACPAAGFISAKELSKALASYGHFQATDKEVEQVIAEATHNADRKISYDVFKRVMMAH